MAVDTPAKIAVVGAGPTGLEAALYARYLGYEVELFERGEVAATFRQSAHLRMFAPWRECVTTLGIASLENQDASWKPAAAGDYLTYGEFAERYLLPLARCDLLTDCVRERTEVVGLGRETLLKGDYLQDERRIDVVFRLLVREADDQERIEQADVVFDCTGVGGTPNWLGNGGVPAIGEQATRDRVDYGVPDVLGAGREKFADKQTLVVGSGYGAAAAVTQLAKLAASAPNTRITWAVRRGDESTDGPIVEIADDPLPARAALARAANDLARQAGGVVDYYPATKIEAVDGSGLSGRFAVEFSGRHPGHAEFDRIVACVGHRPDRALWSEMQLLECPATGAPLPMAEFLRREQATPTLEMATFRRNLAQALLNPEPDFYVLGAKSYGRRGDYLLGHGHDQIRSLFTVIGDRENLDLYAMHKPR